MLSLSKHLPGNKNGRKILRCPTPFWWGTQNDNEGVKTGGKGREKPRVKLKTALALLVEQKMSIFSVLSTPLLELPIQKKTEKGRALEQKLFLMKQLLPNNKKAMGRQSTHPSAKEK